MSTLLPAEGDVPVRIVGPSQGSVRLVFLRSLQSLSASLPSGDITSSLSRCSQSKYALFPDVLHNGGEWVVSSYKESRNNMSMYGCMLPNLNPIPSPNLYQVQSVYNNNVAP